MTKQRLGSAMYARLAAEFARDLMMPREAALTGRPDRFALLGKAHLEYGGVTFENLAQGCTRIALLGPDGVVYKAFHMLGNRSAPLLHKYDLERRVFGWADREGVSWCPDYWPYDAHHVMAMRQYQPLGWADDQPRPADPTVHPGMPVTGYEDRPEFQHLVSVVNDEPGSHAVNIGRDENDRIVLLDGGGGLLW